MVLRVFLKLLSRLGLNAGLTEGLQWNDNSFSVPPLRVSGLFMSDDRMYSGVKRSEKGIRHTLRRFGLIKCKEQVRDFRVIT